MPAYLIVDTLIENADEYEKYKALAKPIAEQYGDGFGQGFVFFILIGI